MDKSKFRLHLQFFSADFACLGQEVRETLWRPELIDSL